MHSHTGLCLLRGLNLRCTRVLRGVFCYENAGATREISAIRADLLFITLFFVAIRRPRKGQCLEPIKPIKIILIFRSEPN